ncbi:MAG TPA: hypothetical protein VGR88_05890 [Ktedonobacterales bacterium]|nr:hypothetical protein [Ktedonobacterales bacterium]
MTSLRVARMLDEIGKLSADEQSELLRDLPAVLRGHSTPGGVNPAGVQAALALREQVRVRLASEGGSAGSVEDDLDNVRDGRLGELDAPVAPDSGVS